MSLLKQAESSLLNLVEYQRKDPTGFGSAFQEGNERTLLAALDQASRGQAAAREVALVLDDGRLGLGGEDVLQPDWPVDLGFENLYVDMVVNLRMREIYAGVRDHAKMLQRALTQLPDE